MTGLYIVIGVLIVSSVLLLVAVIPSKSRGWRLRSPLQRMKPTKKRKSIVKKKKKQPIIQITFNKR